MAERILDMGDILSIAEKVEGIVSEEEASNMAKKMKKGDYTLEDFLTNLKQIKKLGPLENILKMLPGARKMGLGDININPKDMAHVVLKSRKVFSLLKYSILLNFPKCSCP